MSPPLPAAATNIESNSATMSDDSATITAPRGTAGLPILTDENFADWDLQVIAHLTGVQNHVRVITQTRQSDGTLVNPTKPSPAAATATADEKKTADEAIASWEKSERVALGCLMATAGPPAPRAGSQAPEGL